MLQRTLGSQNLQDQWPRCLYHVFQGLRFSQKGSWFCHNQSTWCVFNYLWNSASIPIARQAVSDPAPKYHLIAYILGSLLVRTVVDWVLQKQKQMLRLNLGHRGLLGSEEEKVEWGIGRSLTIMQTQQSLGQLGRKLWSKYRPSEYLSLGQRSQAFIVYLT